MKAAGRRGVAWVRGSDEGQLNIREQESKRADSGGGVRHAWYRRGKLVTGSPAPGRKEVCGWKGSRFKGSVAVAPTVL